MAGVTGPFDQQYVRPTMKNIAISTTAAALFCLSGKEVVNEDRIKSAADWIANPHIKRLLRPNLSTVKVLTSTMKSCRTDCIPLMTSACLSVFHLRDSIYESRVHGERCNAAEMLQRHSIYTIGETLAHRRVLDDTEIARIVPFSIFV